MERKKIAIIGAAGFVGIELVCQMEDLKNFDLYAITQDNGSFLLSKKNITVLNSEGAISLGPFDVVVNLAYPTTSLLHLFPQANAEIISVVEKVTGPSTRIIHVSTQAVFGFGMDKKIQLNRVKNRRDHAYIEAKIEMENLILDKFPQNSVTIVRLGNVWGAGSAGWTGSIIQRLLFGQYVGVEGRDGYANITDVRNVAAYLRYLVCLERLDGVNFYHLAEFSSLKWLYLINLMAKELNVKPVLSDLAGRDSKSLLEDISNAIKIPKIGETYRKLVWGRFSGSYLRAIVRKLGTKRFMNIKKGEKRALPISSHLNNSDSLFLSVVTSNVEFVMTVHPGFEPVIDFEKSWDLVKQWMVEIGYFNRN